LPVQTTTKYYPVDSWAVQVYKRPPAPPFHKMEDFLTPKKNELWPSLDRVEVAKQEQPLSNNYTEDLFQYQIPEEMLLEDRLAREQLAQAATHRTTQVDSNTSVFECFPDDE